MQRPREIEEEQGRNMVISYLFSFTSLPVEFHNQDAQFIEQPYRQSNNEQREGICRRRNDRSSHKYRHDSMFAPFLHH